MSDCTELEALIEDEAAGLLVSGERRVLREHLTGCPGCRQLLAAEERLLALGRQAAHRPALDRSFNDAVWRQLKATADGSTPNRSLARPRRPRPLPRRRVIPLWPLAAAGIAAALFLAFLLSQIQPDREGSPPVRQAETEAPPPSELSPGVPEEEEPHLVDTGPPPPQPGDPTPGPAVAPDPPPPLAVPPDLLAASVEGGAVVVPSPDPTPEETPESAPRQLSSGYAVVAGQAEVLSGEAAGTLLGPGDALPAGLAVRAEGVLELAGEAARLTLSSDAQLHLAVSGGPPQLAGGQLFCTAAAPFKLSLGDSAIQVEPGTEAEIRREDRSVEVAVIAGRARLDLGRRQLDLEEGDACRLAPGRAPRKGRVADPLAIGLWRLGLEADISPDRTVAAWSFARDAEGWQGGRWEAAQVPGGGRGCLRVVEPATEADYGEAVTAGDFSQPLDLSGPLRIRFRYHLEAPATLTVQAWNQSQDKNFYHELPSPVVGRWTLADVALADLVPNVGSGRWEETDRLWTLTIRGKDAADGPVRLLVDEVLVYRTR